MTQPEYNSNLRFPHASGAVEALQNDLTLRASTSGDVLVSSPAAMRPEVDASQDLGLSFLRWRNLNVSGINDIPIGSYIAPQTTVNGISGAITLDSPNDTISVVVNGQVIELDAIFTWASGQLVEQHSRDLLILSGLILPDAGQTSINGLSGALVLTSPNGSILIGDSPQGIEISGLFTTTSGSLVQQHSVDLLTLSGLILSDGGQTSINGLSGILTLTSPDGSILIGDGSQAIELSGLFTNTSGALVQQHSADLLSLSGLILPDGGQTSVNGISGEIFLTAGNDGITVLTGGATISLSPLFTEASGAVLQQKCADIDTLSGLILADSGQTSVNGLSGVVEIVSPDNSVGIAINGQNIELTVDVSGACLVGEFAPSDGTLFTVTHGLDTEDFTWSMWRTDTSPHTTMFGNVAASGLNHAVIELATPVSGKIVLQGCGVGGASSAESFSTTEELTGGLWIDDKPIYKKTVAVPAGPVNSTVLTAHGITGVDTWIKWDWMMFNTANTVARMLPQPEANPVVFLQGAIVSDDLFMNTGVGGDWSDYTGHCTIYYTKT